jgi:hypothetical protein
VKVSLHRVVLIQLTSILVLKDSVVVRVSTRKDRRTRGAAQGSCRHRVGESPSLACEPLARLRHDGHRFGEPLIVREDDEHVGRAPMAGMAGGRRHRDDCRERQHRRQKSPAARIHESISNRYASSRLERQCLPARGPVPMAPPQRSVLPWSRSDVSQGQAPLPAKVPTPSGSMESDDR